jgi:hypothetical protein
MKVTTPIYREFIERQALPDEDPGIPALVAPHGNP